MLERTSCSVIPQQLASFWFMTFHKASTPIPHFFHFFTLLLSSTPDILNITHGKKDHESVLTHTHHLYACSLCELSLIHNYTHSLCCAISLLTSFIMCVCVRTSQRMLATLRCVWTRYSSFIIACVCHFSFWTFYSLWPLSFLDLSTFSSIQGGTMPGSSLMCHPLLLQTHIDWAEGNKSCLFISMYILF